MLGAEDTKTNTVISLQRGKRDMQINNYRAENVKTEVDQGAWKHRRKNNNCLIIDMGCFLRKLMI